MASYFPSSLVADDWGECFERMTGVGFTTPIRIRKDMVNGMGPAFHKGGPMFFGGSMESPLIFTGCSLPNTQRVATLAGVFVFTCG